MAPRLLAGWWCHSLREEPEESEQVWKERQGRQSPSPAYQVTGHSGSFLELRVLGRLRQGVIRPFHRHCGTCSCQSEGIQPWCQS